MYKRKGGISAPVLAILTFAVLLVVGVAILMYFYVIAPQATQQSQLSVLGEPVIRNVTEGDSEYKYNLTVTVKNLGSDEVELTGAAIIIEGTSYTNAVITTSINGDAKIAPGQSETVWVVWTISADDIDNNFPQANQLYTVILQTNYGNFEFSAVFRA